MSYKHTACIISVFKHFCGPEEEHVPDTRPDEEEDNEGEVEMQEMNVAMETDTINEPPASGPSKKKRKKKKKPRNL